MCERCVWVALCCSVLVCCSVLQRVTMRCSESVRRMCALQCVTVLRRICGVCSPVPLVPCQRACALKRVEVFGNVV